MTLWLVRTDCEFWEIMFMTRRRLRLNRDDRFGWKRDEMNESLDERKDASIEGRGGVK